MLLQFLGIKKIILLIKGVTRLFQTQSEISDNLEKNPLDKLDIKEEIPEVNGYS